MSFEIVCDILDETLVVENDAWLGNTVLFQLSDESSSCDTIVNGGKIVGAVHLYRLIASRLVEDDKVGDTIAFRTAFVDGELYA